MEARLIKRVNMLDLDTNETFFLKIYKMDTGGLVGLDERYLGEVEDGVSSPYDTDDNESLNLND